MLYQVENPCKMFHGGTGKTDRRNPCEFEDTLSLSLVSAFFEDKKVGHGVRREDGTNLLLELFRLIPQSRILTHARRDHRGGGPG